MMAGSYQHCTNEDGTYRGGTNLLDDMGDAGEAIDHMWFMIDYLSRGDRAKIQAASDEFYRCVRREQPWPESMKRGME
jgi:hypothetical protein